MKLEYITPEVEVVQFDYEIAAENCSPCPPSEPAW
jgi:hypothetical protein